MDISVPEYTAYFSGYLDAVSRVYTNDENIYGITARIIPISSSLEIELGVSVLKEQELENMVESFEVEVSKFLNVDPRERLIFYLVEYFSWFKEYTNSCTCKSYAITGNNIPDNNLVYTLCVNGKYNVMVYFGVSKKSA